MGEQTKIQWTDHTFQPWIGCTKVSEGCAHCYAEEQDRFRFSKTLGGATKENPIPHWGKGAPRYRTAEANWREPLKWNKPELLRKCIGCGKQFADSWKQHPTCSTCGGDAPFQRPRVFFSLGDWLDDEVPIEWLADFLKLIHDTPNLDWLLLTKRPENWYGRISDALIVSQGGDPTDKDWFTKYGDDFPNGDFPNWLNDWTGGEYPENVWIGTSTENQEQADIRIPHLLKIPAKVRFLSVEPMLGPIDFGVYTEFNPFALGGIDWVIFGGESGKDARPCNVDWIRDGVEQCRAGCVAPFVKQLGGRPIVTRLSVGCKCDFAGNVIISDPKGGDINEWPRDLRVREFPEL